MEISVSPIQIPKKRYLRGDTAGGAAGRSPTA